VETGLAPRLLELELTESVLRQDLDRATSVFRSLRESGVRLALTGFTNGYSSLRHLNRCPVDVIRIDRAYLPDAVNPEQVPITHAVINLAHALKLKVVADDVETEEQFDLLVGLNCDAVQGPFVGGPVAAAGVPDLLCPDEVPAARRLRARRAAHTVLLVDDEPHIVSTLRRVLRQEGYEIVAASNGPEALRLLATRRVDVIVADQRMRGMSGAQFLREARDLFPGTPRIVLSGYTDVRSITEAVNEAGIYKFLTKPWDDQELRDAIAMALRMKVVQDHAGRSDAGAPVV
jgi:CheY-like chemotaxis protein